LPPIEFLKKHNPLRRRRHKPKIGFDQPPQEIRQLALPLRPAPPSLSMRLYVLVRPYLAWMGDRVMTGAMAVRHAAFVAAAHTQHAAGAAWGRVRPAMVAVRSRIAARAVASRDSRLVRAVAGKVEAVAARVGVVLQPAVWPATRTAALMQRTVRVRSALAATVACEWTAAVGLMLMLAVLGVTGRGWDRASIHACGLVLSLLSLTGLVLHTWHSNLVGAWRGLELFICGSCGGLRNFSPSLACPTCGTDHEPVFPGQIPATWSRGKELLSPLSVGGPALVACAVLFASKLV
jgi:hypothetical protein